MYIQALGFQETKYHITNNHLLVNFLNIDFCPNAMNNLICITTNNYNLWIITNTN